MSNARKFEANYVAKTVTAFYFSKELNWNFTKKQILFPNDMNCNS